ncbi:hypothetical protein CC86DRAFT_465661 [Ophiobolus disseminans]|uniref:Uncharacterized protein n=1 Tax=Ophiobolus disseminans TaxID=1469910 RepID=A0A6A7A4X2_9PLEO|nr:hypothetical protein CC86DRAFT_465661 [Ophiobolus disseminans]
MGEPPSYAILSHTWETKEMLFRDMECKDPVFYDKHWHFWGTRKQLAHALADVTKIDIDVLQREWQMISFAPYSIATRMFWASRRETTRPEDIVYYLFGLFDVHLPPLYGEGGGKAFIRL